MALFRERGGTGEVASDGSGAAAGVAFIRDGKDPNRGVRVHHAAADHEWALLTRAGTDPVSAQARIIGQANGAANYLDIVLPDEFVAQEGSQNDFEILVRRGESSHTSPAVAASRHISSNARRGGITVTAATAGVAGNNLTVQVSYSQHSVAAAHYSSATRLELTVNSTATAGAVIAAINGARHNGDQLIVASTWLNSASDEVGYLAIGGHPLTGGRDAITSAREPLSFEYAPEIAGEVKTEAFLLTCLPTDTLAAIKALIEAFNFAAHSPFAESVTLAGSGTDTIAQLAVPSSPGDAEEVVGFAGGVDAADPSFVADSAAKTVTATWAGIHSLFDLVAASDDDVEVTAVPGTYLPNKPADPGDAIPFDFDEEGEQGDGAVSLEAVWSGNYSVAAAGTLVRSSAAEKYVKPNGFSDSDYLIVSIGGEGHAWIRLVPGSVIAEAANGAAVGATWASNGLGMTVAISGTSALSRLVFFAWDDDTGELLFTASSNSVDPMPVTIYKWVAKGTKGPKGDPGENPEVRNVTASLWHDDDADSAIPGDASTEELAVGRLHPFQFPANADRRYLHAAVDEAYEITTFAINGLEQISQFNSETSGGNRLYHSPRMKAKTRASAIDCLIAVDEA